MSKRVWLGIGFLVVIMLVIAGLAAYLLMQKQTLEGQLSSTQNQLAETQNKVNELNSKIAKYTKDNEELGAQVEEKKRESAQAQASLAEVQRKADDLQTQVDQVSQERDEWKSRIETARRERDDIMWKLKQQMDRADKAEKAQKSQENVDNEVAAAPSVTESQGEDYWAGILKQKAALQLELDKIKSDLDKSSLEVVELKKQNSDLQLQLKEVKDDKDEIERKIKYGEDLANNLSIELARARNDQKFTNDRADKLKEQNLQLQDQIRQLMTTKVALERTVAHLNEDKTGMQKKLAETESVIQGRINEIWQIKETLDQKISNIPNTKPASTKTEVELPPIIVNSGAGASSSAAGASGNVQPKDQGVVLSINLANNFVITDLGQDNSKVKVGHILKVSREGKEVATLEIIQVRRDISAADIKQKNTDIKVGDTVKTLNE